MNILAHTKHMQQSAQKIVEDAGVISAWESIGATVHIVGSLQSGLIMKNKDIDLHIYTERLDIAESFSVMQQLAKKMPLREVNYRNGIDTEEECIEWHALYEAPNREVWKLDMIHIRKGSKYDGTVEKVTDAIIRRLTPELRKTILQIKYEVPDGMVIPSIEIYRAVFSGNIRTYKEFEQWRQINPLTNSLDWLPE